VGHKFVFYLSIRIQDGHWHHHHGTVIHMEKPIGIIFII